MKKIIIHFNLIVMADREQITQPSLGSNELGTETNDTHLSSGVSTGTDTQLHLAALSGKKHKKNVNDDEKVVKNSEGETEFLTPGETDE
ncbi:MAG: hypothetical protein ABI472_15075 [Ginsengibacter sp.]